MSEEKDSLLQEHDDEKDVPIINKTKLNTGFNTRLALSIAAITLGSAFQFGYNTGVVNTPEHVIKDFFNVTYFDRYGEYMVASSLTLLWSVTVSIYAVGGMIGGVSAGYWANKYGRKGALMRNNTLAIIAAGLLGFSKMAQSYEMLIAGRFISGLNAGINTGIVPMYLSEIAPIALRGLAGTFNQLAITFGVLVSQLLGIKLILGTEKLWPICLAMTGVPVLFQLVTLSCCAESPRYLMLSKDDEGAARMALAWLRKSYDVNEELEEMKLEKSEEQKRKKFVLSDLFIRPELRTPLIISVILQLAQQFSGINAVIYYSTSIFEGANLSSESAQYATLGTGSINVAMTFVSALIIDRAGRRVLLISGLGGMFVFTITLTIALVYQASEAWLSYVCIAAVVCYIISFALGPGSIPWLIVSELFAQGPRSSAVSIAVLVNWVSNFIVGIVFPHLQTAINVYSFVPFSCLLLIFFIFTLMRVPETKGKTIDEITNLFKPQLRVSNIEPDCDEDLLIQKD